MKKITLIKSLLGFSLVGGMFLTTTLTTNCGTNNTPPQPPYDMGYLRDGTNWKGYISGTLECRLLGDNTCTITNNYNYEADATFTIPETIVVDEVEYTITVVERGAFANSLIAGVNLNGVISAERDAFTDCKNLTKVNLGNVEILWEEVFSGCDKLSQVDLNNVTALGNSAFNSCPLSSITISPNNEEFAWVGDDSHNGFIQRKSDEHTLSPACENGGGIACGNITIPEDITAIDDYAFSNSNGLTSVNLNEVTTVNGNVFSGCGKLAEVNLASATFFGAFCFASCPLSSITISPNNEEFAWVGDDSHNGFIQRKSDGTILTPVCGTYGGIACGEITIREDINIVDASALARCAGITAVNCYATTINQSAFSNCANLVSFNCPSGIVTIGNYAFTKCTSLNDINLASATTIGQSAFMDCTELTSAYLSAIVEIDAYAFADCTNLKTLELGGDLGAIGAYAFRMCPFEDVQLQPTNTAFSWVGTDSHNGFLQNVTDENTLTPVCDSQGWQIGGIACGEITIPSTITAISESCFDSTMGITSIDLSAPSTLDLGYNWCVECRNLSSITIGASTIYTANQYDEWDNVGANVEQCFLYAPNNIVAENFKSNIIKGDTAKWQVIINS